MSNQQKYNILISADCLSSLSEKDLSNKLVASLYDIDTKEKISDGDNNNFEILDYHFTNVATNSCSIEIFINDEIKKAISKIIINNGYNNSLFDEKLFDKAIKNSDFIITEYEIGRIYTLAEIYFKITQKPSPYNSIVKLIVSYDVHSNKNNN